MQWCHGAAAAALAVVSATAFAQEPCPSKLVRLVTPAAGGNADIIARFVSVGLTESLGQQVIVDNRGAIAPGVVAKAPPDGYSVLVTGSPAWLLPVLKPGVGWDAKDFAPVTLATTSPSLLVVHPSLPVANVRQLIALASAGSEVIVNSPDAFAAKMRVDIERVAKLVQSGPRPQ